MRLFLPALYHSWALFYLIWFLLFTLFFSSVLCSRFSKVDLKLLKIMPHEISFIGLQSVSNRVLMSVGLLHFFFIFHFVSSVGIHQKLRKCEIKAAKRSLGFIVSSNKLMILTVCISFRRSYPMCTHSVVHSFFFFVEFLHLYSAYMRTYFVPLG